MVIPRVVVYCKSEANVEWLTDKMTAYDFTVSSLHSGQSRDERYQAVRPFLCGTTKVVICQEEESMDGSMSFSDFFKEMVICFDLPLSPKSYLEHIGLTGHFGMKGCCISLVAEHEMKDLESIEYFFSTRAVFVQRKGVAAP